jgi:SAM-dependent methyltransferase
MTAPDENRFEDFFGNEKYVALKNGLYNYLLRKRAVERAMRDEAKGVVLEVGSGLSPVLASWGRTVYSDLSFAALATSRRLHGKGHYVVADGMNLPFRAGVFSHVVASEVLEHLEDDRKALREIAGVLAPGGGLVVTFPHRRFYFANDDRFVHHHRRYEQNGMQSRLLEAGFDIVSVRKVLGPLEKITMMLVTGCLTAGRRGEGTAKRAGGENRKLGNERSGADEPDWALWGGKKKERERDMGGAPSLPEKGWLRLYRWANRAYAGLAWIDACVMPRALSAVLLIRAVSGKGHEISRGRGR